MKLFMKIYFTILVVVTIQGFLLHSVHAFGKNKITYQKFHWLRHQTDHFTFYYYPEEERLIPEIIEFFESAYARISDDLGTELSGRTPVILYKSHREFQQTNIYPGFLPTGVGGFAEPIKRRVVIPLDGPKKELESLIIHELVHTFEFEVFFQNRVSRIASVPLWIMEGLSEHLANDWDAVGRMVLRDAMINNLLPHLTNLNSFDRMYSPYLGYKAGQSAMDFLRDEYGIEKIQRLLWEIRKTLRTQQYFNKAIKRIFGKSLSALSAEWMAELRKRFIEIERRREGVIVYDEYVKNQERFQTRYAPVFSKGGELISFLEAGKDGYHVYMGSTDSEKEKLFDCLTCDLDMFKYRQVITEGRPLSGNPWSDQLVYLAQRENRVWLHVLDPIVGGLIDSIRLPQDQPTSPTLSPDGKSVVYAAYENGQSDLFVVDLQTKETRQLTNDIYVDATPSYSPDGRYVAYSTERDRNFELYLYNIETGESTPLVLSPGKEQTPAFSPDGNKLTYISDRIDGVLDPYIMDLNSGDIKRIAAPITGMFMPSFSPDGKKVAVAFFYAGSQRIVVLSVDREIEIQDIAETIEPFGTEGELFDREFKDYEPASDVPQSPEDLQNKAKDFRLVPDYAIGIISYGSETDFTAEGGVMLSDILGDHQIQLIGIRRDNRNGISGQYIYLRNRIDYGFSVLNDSDYYYLFDFDNNVYQKVEWKYFGANVHAEYPFTTFYRAEVDLGHFQRDYESSVDFYDNYDEKYFYIEPAIAGDTVKYRNLTGYPEPYQGQRFRLSIQLPIHISDDYEKFVNTRFDYRAYFPFTDRSLFALREWGILSSGDNARFYGIGGFNTIRGYDYNSIVVNNFAITNFEFRFPLVDVIQFPAGLRFTGFRGKIFVDAGAVWFDEGDEEWKFDDPETFEQEGNLIGSYGWGFNFWLGGLEWHFEWARKTDFKSFDGDWVYQWSIRRSF